MHPCSTQSLICCSYALLFSCSCLAHVFSSHAEAPVSLAISTAFCSELGRVAWQCMLLASEIWACRLAWQAACFAWICSSCASSGKSFDCSMMCLMRGAVTSQDVCCWVSACLARLMIPSPPSWDGSVIKFLHAWHCDWMHFGQWGLKESVVKWHPLIVGKDPQWIWNSAS